MTRLRELSRSARVAPASLLLAASLHMPAALSQTPTQYGQPAGTALEQPMPQYGQPAGAALEQPMPQYGQPAGAALEQPMPQYGRPAGAALEQPMPQLGPPPGSSFNQASPPPFPNGAYTQFPQSTQPLGTPPGPLQQAVPFDVTSVVLSRMELDLENAEFMASHVGSLHMILNDLNMRNGTLKGLNILVKGGQFRELAFDQLNIVAQGDLSFDRAALLESKTLQFTTPATAQVLAVVSQASLNSWLNNPNTLKRLSVTAANKVKFIATMLGSNANVGVSLDDASVALLKGNRVNVGVHAKIGMGTMAMPLPLSLDTKLALNDQGWISLSDTHLDANGTEISPLLSSMLVKRFNEMTGWGRSPDINFSFSDLKVVPNKQFVVRGTAQVSRLRFGQM